MARPDVGVGCALIVRADFGCRFLDGVGVLIDVPAPSEDMCNEGAGDHCYQRYCHLKSGETLESDRQELLNR